LNRKEVKRMPYIQNVVKYRKMMGLTQSDLADKFGISQSAYNQKEKGVIKFSYDEMLAFKMLVNESVDPTATIDSIFFSNV